MYLNYTSSGERCDYGISIIPGRPMESSAVLAEFQIEETVMPQFMAPELDWENIIPKDLPESQLV